LAICAGILEPSRRNKVGVPIALDRNKKKIRQILNTCADLFHTLFANTYLDTMKKLAHARHSFLKDFVNVYIL
jgi:hypothetical protein